MNRWLDSEGLDVGDVGEAVVEAFLVARRAAGYRAHLKLASLLPLLTYLRGLGVARPRRWRPGRWWSRSWNASGAICWPNVA